MLYEHVAVEKQTGIVKCPVLRKNSVPTEIAPRLKLAAGVWTG